MTQTQTLTVVCTVAGLVILGIIVDAMLQDAVRNTFTVKIVKGPHAGRSGTVVSMPWIGNLYNRRMTVNVAATEDEIHERYDEGWGDRVQELIDRKDAGVGPRAWLKVWSSEVERQ